MKKFLTNKCSFALSVIAITFLSLSSANAQTQLIQNSGFESGSGTSVPYWTLAGGAALNGATGSSQYAHTGLQYLILGGAINENDSAYQAFTVPSGATPVTLSFWYSITSQETAIYTPYDTMTITIRNSGGSVLQTIATYSNLNKDSAAGTWHQVTANLAAYAGQTIQICFSSSNDSTYYTTFRIDDVSVLATTSTSYSINISASPSAGGSVGGGGTYSSGGSATVTATANSGYTFANWTENGSIVSYSASYNFTVSGNRTLVANFSQNSVNYTISLSASPSAGGFVGGGGTYASGSSRTVTATANSGYTFANWTESGSAVSSSSSYTFTLTANRNLVANFISTGGTGYPGAIWVGPAASGNYGTGRNGNTITYIIVHTTEGSMASALSRFQTAGQQASSHYIIGTNGTIWQVVGDADTAYHCGNLSYNYQSIGIEQEGWADGNPAGNFSWQTDAQRTALENLINWLHTQYGPPLDRAHIIGHNQVPSPGGSYPPTTEWGGYDAHYDPGAWFNWRHLMTDLGHSPNFTPIRVQSATSILTLPQTGAPIITPTTIGQQFVAYDYYNGYYLVFVSGYELAQMAADGTTVNLPSGERHWDGWIPASSVTTVANAVQLEVTNSFPQRWLVHSTASLSSSIVAHTIDGKRYVATGNTAIADGYTWREFYIATTANTVATGWAVSKAFTVIGNSAYTISVSASPSAGGTVGGGGTFAPGSSQTVTATANSGYTFANWTESGSVVSSSSSYTFTLGGNRTLVANFTVNPVNYTIAVSASPSAGGTVGGGGTFVSGSSQTVTATANSGYTFANWTESGSVVSSSSSYTFTLNGNRTLVANFTANPVNYTIAVSASPSSGGTVGGGGTYAFGSSRTVTATANSGYTFANWTEGGNVVSSSASYTFTLTANRTLVANFTASPQTGSVTVNINPPAAVSAGAQWQVDGGAWHNSGATVSSLSVGNHTVAFKAVSGWTTPGNQTVTINANQTTTATGTYVAAPSNPPQLTGIAVNTNGMFLFDLNGLAGSNYVIQVSSNLVNWVNLVTNVIPAGGLRVLDFPIQTNQRAMYYRALPLAQGPLVLQPGPIDGQAIWTTSIYSNGTNTVGANGIADENFLVGGWGDYYNSYLKFDLTGLPAHATSATVQLYSFAGWHGGAVTVTMYLDRVTQDWDAIFATGIMKWADQPASTNLRTIAAPAIGAWYSFDVTDLYNAWQAGTYPNYGIALRPTGNSDQFNYFWSSRYLVDPTLRPKLVIVP